MIKVKFHTSILYLYYRFIYLLLITISISCTASNHPNSSHPLIIKVQLPSQISDDPTWTALQYAADDVEYAAQAISGADQFVESPQKIVTNIQVLLDSTLSQAVGIEGYILNHDDSKVTVKASTPIGAAYGLYHIAGDLGARYFHPEDQRFPLNRALTVPRYQSLIVQPRFIRRGFHEHTQHPIVMSEYLLKSNVDGYRDKVSRYLRWLLRNRQNTLSFHMLNTVSLDQWVPYMNDISAEAESLGIELGVVIGFVDQQQNAFRLVFADDARSPDEQIISKLDTIVSAGISLITFQIGTSEFTKPDETQVLHWLNLSVEHLAMAHPDVSPFTWIHITCDLLQETGEPFYHLSLKADERLGAFVHTTMFYTIDHPAPVYECEDFTHQRDYLDSANGNRAQVFFPETAWWLGFDNNVPLVNPITGQSREYDLYEALPTWDIEGHITFTTGREWTYWQYDHYLTQATWESRLTWAEYLEWLSPVYGSHSHAVQDLILNWTTLQWQQLYEEKPLSYFYLAGELPQDELGAQAGVLARRPKLPFRALLSMDDNEIESWKTNDLDYLLLMKEKYLALFSTDLIIPPNDQDDPLYVELYLAYQLFIWRIEHSIALYTGALETRLGNQVAADDALTRAQMIGSQAMEAIHQGELLYRYPKELLVDELPQSLTAYPFGYLHETSTGYFWRRREMQLSQFINEVFNPPMESWNEESQTPIYSTQSETLNLEIPNSEVLREALSGFLPRLIVRTSINNSENTTLLLAQDSNENTLPDVSTLQRLSLERVSSQWIGTLDAYPLFVRDAAGVSLGQLTLIDAVLHVDADEDLRSLTSIQIEAQVNAHEMISLVTAIAGIEEDALAQLIKSVWSLPLAEPLPDQLPLKVQIELAMTMNTP